MLSLSLISNANYEEFFVECHQCAQCCNQAIKPELGKDALKLEKLAEKQNGNLESPALNLQAELPPETNKEPLQGASLRSHVSKALRHVTESKGFNNLVEV